MAETSWDSESQMMDSTMEEAEEAYYDTGCRNLCGKLYSILFCDVPSPFEQYKWSIFYT